MNTQPSRALADAYYRALEDRFRGSRAAIKQRLAVYLPAVLPLAARNPALPAFDIGCGRGEWLELLGEHGVPARGMDLDADMLAACHEQGLAVEQGDAIAWLQQQPAQSLLAITAFHVVEHLELTRLCTLLSEARRVLAVDGVLILETPNPENLVVGTASFYIDPTHQRPLPQQLLGFLAEHAGFASVEVHRLQEEERLRSGVPAGLYDVLGGVSPDYAIVARIQPDPSAAPASGGVALYDLACRYDESLRQRFNAQSQAVHALQVLAEGLQQQLAGELASFRSQLAAARDDAADAQARALNAQTEAAHASAVAEQMHTRLQAVFTSTSWRITAPLRWLRRLVSRK